HLRSAIKPAIGALIQWLTDATWPTKHNAVNIIEDLATHVDLHNAIKPVLPFLIQWLVDGNPDVQVVVLSALNKLLSHDELRDAIGIAISSVIELLHHQDAHVRESAISTLVFLSPTWLESSPPMIID
ncbi:hypothetical protein M408DRAFT_25969, partial [Serendipita vermifera MAFF 305830]